MTLESSNLYFNLINDLPQMVWYAENTGEIVFSNKAWNAYSGNCKDVLSKSLIHPDDYKHTLESWSDAQNTGHFSVSRQLRYDEDKSYRWFLTRGERSENNQWVGTCTDIQEIVMLQKEHNELLLREKMALHDAEMKSAFLANVSHELRTPLYGIMTFVEFLLETSLLPVQRECANTLSQSVTYLSVVIEDILDITRLELGKLVLEKTAFDPSLTINNTVSILNACAVMKELSIVLNIEKMPDKVVGDQNRLQQILVNVINNSIKFTEKGCIKLNVSSTTKGDVCTILIEVTDTGIGIPEENLVKLFVMFQQVDSTTTRPFGGLGLGLLISLKLAKLMDGSVDITSKVNVGTTVTVKCSLKVPSRGSAIASNIGPRDLTGIHVLVFEDNVINQKIVLKILGNVNAKVTCAGDGAQGLELYGKCSYDLILMDCHMPKMDGYAATKKLRALGCKLRIIALTANAAPDNLARCIEVGMDEALTKPFKPSVLIQKVYDYSSLRT
jgi:signal transduction histidine kinase